MIWGWIAGNWDHTRVVRFVRSGPKSDCCRKTIWRTGRISDNEEERQAIAESFARSVVWGFDDT